MQLVLESEESLNTFINSQVLKQPQSTKNHITDPNLRALFEKST